MDKSVAAYISMALVLIAVGFGFWGSYGTAWTIIVINIAFLAYVITTRKR